MHITKSVPGAVRDFVRHVGRTILISIYSYKHPEANLEIYRFPSSGNRMSAVFHDRETGIVIARYNL
jgi:hypothetical protein